MKKLLVVAFAIPLFVSAPRVDAQQALRCPEMKHITKMVAKEIGWDKTRKIDFIMWRESRCNPKAINTEDPYGGSLGLFQINQFWCKPSRSTGKGILVGWNILDTCRELYKPRTAAEAFVAIYDYVEKYHRDGWIPWGGEPWT